MSSARMRALADPPLRALQMTDAEHGSLVARIASKTERIAACVLFVSALIHR